jgi:hypothetical protein
MAAGPGEPREVAAGSVEGRDGIIARSFSAATGPYFSSKSMT